MMRKCDILEREKVRKRKILKERYKGNCIDCIVVRERERQREIYIERIKE